MKKLFALVLLTAAVTTVQAQRRSTVSGVVADADTHRTIIGALVGMSPVADSTKVNHIVTGAGGAFSTGVDRGEWNFEVSLLGYETLKRRVDVVAARTSLDTLFLQQGIVIENVVKTAVALRTSLEGDTLIYNADSYKVASDANVSGLLEKMPGIKVEDGAVEAQGEAVKKVLIDGREFFGEDVAAAISALPAEAVKSIEVFDKLSDNAEFTGIDDGEGYKAINITTRENMRQGVMGQVSALYGVEPPDGDTDKWNHYGLVGGNVNIFNGDAKITVGGTLNNLNERHFTSDDILGAGDDDGIAKVGRFQVNYIDMLGKKNQWKVDASYTYQAVDTDNHSVTDREYFDNENYAHFYSESDRSRFNQNHSLNARIDYKPNAYNELRIRPSFRYQGSSSDRSGFGRYTPLDGSAPISLDNQSNDHETGWMAGLNANYRVRLGKPGRTLSFFFNGSYDPDDENQEDYTERLLPDNSIQAIRQRTPSLDYNYRLMGGLTYTEPVSSSSLVNFDYSISYNYEDVDHKSYLWDNDSKSYLTQYDDNLSGQYNSGYLTNRAGPGYRGQWGKTTFSAGAFYQYSTLENNRVLPTRMNLAADFHNVTYASMIDAQFTNGTSIRLRLFSRTQNPSVGDLQDVPDISNTQNIKKGNPNLRPSYNTMGFLRFIMPNVEKGRTFAFNIGGSYAFNSIAGSTISSSEGYPILDGEGNTISVDGQPLVLDAVSRYSTPVNMDGQWNAQAGVDYGFPLTFMKSNLNLNANVRYGESPSQMGRWQGGDTDNVIWTTNYSRNLSTGAGLTLGSNISEKIDFRVSYYISYNNVRNTFSDRSDSEYLQHILRGDAKFVLPKDFTIAANFFYNNYAALTGLDLSRSYVFVNAAVGKKIFRNRQGEISLFVNDIFNQNVDYRPRTNAEYFETVSNSAVGRYFGVKLTWNIRMFGKNGSKNMNLYNIDNNEGHVRGGFERPAGPPPGGFGGGGGHRH